MLIICDETFNFVVVTIIFGTFFTKKLDNLDVFPYFCVVNVREYSIPRGL